MVSSRPTIISSSLALVIRAVSACISVSARSFIEADAEIIERTDDCFRRSLYKTLVICILYPEEEDAAALVGYTLVSECAEEVA